MKPLTTLGCLLCIIFFQFVVAPPPQNPCRHSGFTVGEIKLTVEPRVAPGQSLSAAVIFTTSVTNIPATCFYADFAGDASTWGDFDLRSATRMGNRVILTGAATAPRSQTGLWADMKWNVIGPAQSGTLDVLLGSRTGQVDVTCSNGIFCDGEERFVGGRCVQGLTNPCDDNQPCTENICIEANQTCSYTPGNNCPVCFDKHCVPKCNGKVCGDDRCGGLCGECREAGQYCVEGQCQIVTAAGTCGHPTNIFDTEFIPVAGATGTVLGDTSTAFDLVKPLCNGAPVPDYIYQVRVPASIPSMGFDIRVLSATGDPQALDTVLNILDHNCIPISTYSFCSDDSTPPGGVSSRTFGSMLSDQTYLIAVTGYSTANVGPYELQYKFVPQCVPVCDGKFCGDDGCGGQCGTCSTGNICSPLGRCMAAGACTPVCQGRQCGSNGCGGVCGECKPNQYCWESEGKCKSKTDCVGTRPVCSSTGGGNNKFCGVDCKWHDKNERFIDLVPGPYEAVANSIIFVWSSFGPTSCTVSPEESCIPYPGTFLLMRFDTDIWNIDAQTSFVVDKTSPFLHYAFCHQHYHFDGFAQFSLYDFCGTTKLTRGEKRAYCMEDTSRVLNSPAINCNPTSLCESQGISAGWKDGYTADLDCQWLVLKSTTESFVPLNSWYKLQICTNIDRNFMENTFDNNCRFYDVFIPEISASETRTIYMRDLNPPPKPTTC